VQGRFADGARDALPLVVNLHELLGWHDRIRRIERLDDDLERAVVERRARRVGRRDESLAQTTFREAARAKMTVRIVAGAAEHRVRREAATTHAVRGKRAAPAESPQIVDGPAARERELGRIVPDRRER